MIKRNWTTFKDALTEIGGDLLDPYAWFAHADGTFVFTVEIDSARPERNVWRGGEGLFHKVLEPLSTIDPSKKVTRRHYRQLYDAAKEAFATQQQCYLMMRKHTRYSEDSKPPTKAKLDHSMWVMTTFSGTPEDGYEFILRRQSE